jgi:hypothetical protein
MVDCGKYDQIVFSGGEVDGRRTVDQVTVQFDMVVLPWPALDGCIALGAFSQSLERRNKFSSFVGLNSIYRDGKPRGP